MFLWMTEVMGCALFESLVVPESNPAGVSLGLYGDDPDFASSTLFVAAGDLDGDGRDDLVTHDELGLVKWSGPAEGTFALDEADRLSMRARERAIVVDFGDGPDLGRWTTVDSVGDGVIRFDHHARFDAAALMQTTGWRGIVRRLADGAGPGRDALIWEADDRLFVASLDLESEEWTTREVAWNLGYTIDAATGDLDGDGSADLVVGGPEGQVGVFAGPVWEAPAFVLEGTPGDGFGASIAMADFDGDGALDLACGAPGAYEAQRVPGGGEARIWFGPLHDARRADLSLTGDEPELGGALHALDRDGDGQDELVALPRLGNVAEGEDPTGWIKEGVLFSIGADRAVETTTFEVPHGVVAETEVDTWIVDVDGDGTEELAMAFSWFEGGALMVYGAL